MHPLIFWLRMGIGQALLYLSDVEEAGGPTAVRTSRETHRRNQHPGLGELSLTIAS